MDWVRQKTSESVAGAVRRWVRDIQPEVTGFPFRVGRWSPAGRGARGRGAGPVFFGLAGGLVSTSDLTFRLVSTFCLDLTPVPAFTFLTFSTFALVPALTTGAVLVLARVEDGAGGNAGLSVGGDAISFTGDVLSVTFGSFENDWWYW